jgi:hypothetical protein
MGFMWTGGGYFPKIPPVVGMPTYVIIAEILRRKSVAECLKYLKQIKHAGCFIFFLADATGATALIEAVPGKLEIVQDSDNGTLYRGNHYLCSSILKCGKQKPPPRGTSTVARTNRITELMKQHTGRITPALTRQILTDRGNPWPWLHQWPGKRDAVGLAGMTIDSLFAVCEDRTLWTARGGRVPGPWQSIKAD